MANKQPPHDSFFKAVFGQVEHASALVRRLCPEELLARVDWATMRPEPGSFVNPLLGKRHTDVLFSVRIAGRIAYIYFLLEHQSTNPKRMPLRMLDYSVRIWDLSAASNEEIKSWAMDAFGKAALFALRDVRDPDKFLRDFEHWGRTPSEYQARLARASPEDLERYGERILTADTLEAVFGPPS